MANVSMKSKPSHGGWTKRNRIGFLYVCIWIFGFLVFQLYPFVSSLFYSFTSYDIFHKPEFVGLDNYVRLFTKDKEFWNSLTVTLKYTFITVPGKVVLALIIAMILNRELKGINFIRTVYYIPSLLSGSVAVAILWKVLFMNDGFINSLLGVIHIAPVKWLGKPEMALTTICMLEIWQFGSSMVLFLSALKQVPQSLYEAARIDGLNEFGIFSRIVLPLGKPAMATLTIFTFTNVWNDFMGPLIYLKTKELKTIQLGIRMFISQYGADYAWIMAASVCSLIPVVIVFLSCQKFFVEGVAASGIKG